MSQPLPGSHYCKAHQGNPSHYAQENCDVCRLIKERDEYMRQNERLRSDLRTLEVQYSMQSENIEKCERALNAERISSIDVVQKARDSLLDESRGTISERVSGALMHLSNLPKTDGTVFDADNPRFRAAFDEAITAHGLPMARKGEGYRSPITNWCMLIAYSVVNRLRLYENEIDFKIVKATGKEVQHHAKCRLTFDAYNGDYDCEYRSTIACEDCKYGGFGGKKDPEAKCNQLKD